MGLDHPRTLSHTALRHDHNYHFPQADPLLLVSQLTDDERLVRKEAAACRQDRLAERVTEAFRNETTDIGIFGEGRIGPAGRHDPGAVPGWATPNPIVPTQDFPTADGHMILTIANDGQFARLAEVAGAPALRARCALCHQPRTGRAP